MLFANTSLAGFLGKRGKKYRVQGATATSLTDLRQGSAILISGFDNSWTIRALDPLRFHLVHEPPAPGICSIRDRENPLQKDWSVNFDMPYARVTQDFAIIARFVNSVTDQTEVIAAGIGENGTISAGEFLTNPRFLEQIAARLGSQEPGSSNTDTGNRRKIGTSPVASRLFLVASPRRGRPWERFRTPANHLAILSLGMCDSIG